jgi:dimethylargininase
VVDGLRAADRDNPSYEGIVAEHQAYVAALTSAGTSVSVLPPLEDFPDSVFVEDPALLLPQGAILLRPGAPSRTGEAAAIALTLRDLFEVVLELPFGFADGGDVLLTPHGVMIGLSDRTDRAGAEALAGLAAQLGHEAVIVETPGGVLHLKSACSLLDEETILCTSGLAESMIFNGFRLVVAADGEDAAANALRINDFVLVGAAYPKTAELLDALGFPVVALETAEIGKLDAGLSCLSLRWWDPASG